MIPCERITVILESKRSFDGHGDTNNGQYELKGDFRCGALLFMVIHVIYKYKNK